MISKKDKAYIIFSQLGEYQETVLALLPKKIALFFTDYPKENLNLRLEEEITILQEATEMLFSDESLIIEEKQDSISDENDDAVQDSISDENDDAVQDSISDENIDAVQEESNDLNQYNPPEMIAKKLSQQKDQIISFFISNIDDEMLKQAILYHLGSDVTEKIDSTPVEMTPISRKVYERLYYELCIKKEDEVESSDDKLIKLDSNHSKKKYKVEKKSSDTSITKNNHESVFSNASSDNSFGGLFS